MMDVLIKSSTQLQGAALDGAVIMALVLLAGCFVISGLLLRNAK